MTTAVQAMSTNDESWADVLFMTNTNL